MDIKEFIIIRVKKKRKVITNQVIYNILGNRE